jgi:16S rRNA A1518/A1519 N6-dimethyltransferase RsmA/KsgA/DIM1 with predicted DNA glycosylase/AP lyase activity
MPAKPAEDRAKPDLKKDQAFMVNPKAVRWIVEHANLRKTDTVLEIGAGTGNLTRALAASGARIIAVEKDISLEKELRKNLREFPAVEIVIGNALNLLDARGFRFDKLVSNIPYAISEPLMQRLIFHDFEMAVLTLPKSFAGRLIAAEWEGEYSRLSFVFQRFFIVQVCLDLQRDSFSPMPKTHSVVLKFVSKPKNSVTCQMLLRPDMAAKNALREALCSARGYTKNRARQTIKSLDFNNLMEKRVSELGAEDIKDIVRKASEFRED